MERRDKINYYLDLAEVVSHRSTCLRRHYGAVIVNNDQVISTGYVGAPRGRKNCSDLGKCTSQCHRQCFQRRNVRKYPLFSWY